MATPNTITGCTIIRFGQFVDYILNCFCGCLSHLRVHVGNCYSTRGSHYKQASRKVITVRHHPSMPTIQFLCRSIRRQCPFFGRQWWRRENSEKPSNAQTCIWSPTFAAAAGPWIDGAATNDHRCTTNKFSEFGNIEFLVATQVNRHHGQGIAYLSSIILSE